MQAVFAQDSLKKAEMLDSSPTLAREHCFRDREPRKEVGPEFRFGPPSYRERVFMSGRSRLQLASMRDRGL